MLMYSESSTNTRKYEFLPIAAKVYGIYVT